VLTALPVELIGWLVKVLLCHIASSRSQFGPAAGNHNVPRYARSCPPLKPRPRLVSGQFSGDARRVRADAHQQHLRRLGVWPAATRGGGSGKPAVAGKASIQVTNREPGVSRVHDWNHPARATEYRAQHRSACPVGISIPLPGLCLAGRRARASNREPPKHVTDVLKASTCPALQKVVTWVEGNRTQFRLVADEGAR
jgi:hypothetical protein